MKYIKYFKEVSMNDVPLVGGKNASLGQMITGLSSKGITIPDGFAVTAQAYWYFLTQNNLKQNIQDLLGTLHDYQDISTLKQVGSKIRSAIEQGEMPDDLRLEIEHAYHELCNEYKQKKLAVAVRSSATAEDLPTASFAGQQETFLNVSGVNDLISCCKKSMASLFTDRAIAYRIEQGFDHMKVALSVGIQKMVRSDLASAGVIFTLDTETGFKDVVMINSSYGLGEVVVKGEVIPDEFLVHKPTLAKGYNSIINKYLGNKRIKMVYDLDERELDRTYTAGGQVSSAHFTKTIAVSEQEQNSFSLTEKEIVKLAHFAVLIEAYYSERNGEWTPMDIEWAKDGQDGQLYIVQARPETVHAHKSKQASISFFTLKASAKKLKKSLKESREEPQKEFQARENVMGESLKSLEKHALVTGQSIGNKIAHGTVKIIGSADDIEQVQAGDILVTQMTDPDWVPAMKKAAGIITDRGGRTCHAAIVSRELGIAALVGTQQATEVLKPYVGKTVTIDCSQGNIGYVYEGEVAFKETTISTEQLSMQQVPCQLLLNIANPERAFVTSFLPNDGVGLARIEFIITNTIKIHPMALVRPDKLVDKALLKKINYITRAYADKKQFFVDTLAYGISTIASAFYPKPVIVRFSDFKSNEYRNLIGGIYFEPTEENPMLGWRGASRYYHPGYKDAFALECQAIKKAREEIGLTNIKIMVPFVRTVQEAELVIQELARNGLQKDSSSWQVKEADHKTDVTQNNLEFVMMCEIPSNVLLIDSFCTFFDGFSIGSNDLTQLTLGVDRDSELLSDLFDERDEAVKKSMAMAIAGALRNSKYIGICGQAPSDFPELAAFLIEKGITSVSLNPDALVPFLLHFNKK